MREPAPQSEREPALVLVVEDEQPIAEALSFMIEDAGYATLIASHGQQGLEMARARHPALIFTDLMMPRMDGAALIAALHADAAKDGEHPAPPIILMTAAGFGHAQRAGADIILAKPFDIKDIERLLARFLDHPIP
ncbi:MAG: response regulator [Ktedonobacterales bacterium]